MNRQLALECLRDPQNRFDVILVDMVMPGTSLRQFLQGVESTGANPAIVLMTGHADEALLREGMPETGYPIIRKPFDWDELVKLLGEITVTS